MRKHKQRKLEGIKKSPTGIEGLDEITNGGLPMGRPTLICGSAGSGKTLLAMEFLVRGILEFNEPGAFMAFEENAEELADNVASLGMDIRRLVKQKKMAIDYVHIERSEIEETGEYDLEGIFVRLGTMIDEVKAKRVVLDSVEALFAGLQEEGILRAELRRLFRWLKTKKVTAIITGEKGEKTLTRHGLEEYVSDCVIFLDHRMINQIATRRLRIVKYRGSKHGTNEYPTLIDERGLSVLPISALSLDYAVSSERISSGIKELDDMLGKKGYYRGSTVLISGTPGTGKSSLAAAFANASCQRGEKVVYFSFEESSNQIKRNMLSIRYDLGKWEKKGLLKFHTSRPSLTGLEAHLVAIHKLVEEFQPRSLIIDPITNLRIVGESIEIKSMMTRVVDFLKNRQITAMLTSLTRGNEATEQTDLEISSIIDSWILLRNLERSGDRVRLLYVLKSRGMSIQTDVRKFLITNNGIKLDKFVMKKGIGK